MTRHLTVLCAVALLAFQGPASAQSIQGRLTDGSGGALSGAHLLLLDEAGSPVGATLTDARGAFAFPGSPTGRYTVRGEAAGYSVSDVSVVLPGTDGALTLQAERLLLELPNRAITPDRRCRVSKEGGALVSALWTEVRKALRATALADESGLHGNERRTWSRHLDPDDLQPLDEDVGPVSAFRPGPPFVSPPSEELAQFGFIQGGEGEGYAFYAPDTQTLLSPIFTDSHCLGFTPEGPEEGWVGLTFRPRFPGGLDVAGTLWIDAQSLGPQRLEYQYTALPWSVKTDKVGGRVDFHHLDDGPWVVQRWWIRSPRVGVRTVRLTQWDEPRQKFGLTSVVEEGGEVLRIRFRDGRVERLVTEGS